VATQISIRRLKSASRHVSRAGAAARDAESVIGGFYRAAAARPAGADEWPLHARSIEEFLSDYMREPHAFIVRVRAVLPRGV